MHQPSVKRLKSSKIKKEEKKEEEESNDRHQSELTKNIKMSNQLDLKNQNLVLCQIDEQPTSESFNLLNENKNNEIQDSRQSKVSEKEAFINQFVGCHLGFKADFKEKYYDFIVHELSENGEMITLTDLGENFLEKITNSQSDESVLDLKTNEKLKELSKSSQNDSIEIDVQNFDKNKRRAIHQFIRKNFEGIETNFKMINDKAKIIAIRTKASSRPSKYQEWPSERPNYVHFTLYQENRGTFESILKLSHFLKVNSKNFAFAGTKDKRSISSQRISVYRVDPSKLAKLNKIFSNDSNPLQVGNFSFESEPLRLGKLKGNHFEILLRNVKLENESDLNLILDSVSKNGFINYFGTQRFGMKKAPSFKIGLAMLKNDWCKAVDLVLCERLIDIKSPSSKFPLSFNECMKLWKETRNASEVYSKLYWKSSIEGLVLKGMLNSGQENNYTSGFHLLSRNTKTLYLHSYQSYLWNQLASFRIEEYGLNVVPGDLLLFTELQEIDVKDFSPIIATPEILKRATIFDVVIPTPGFATILPENKIRDKLLDLLSKDGLSLESFSIQKKTYYLSGSYRKLITKPFNIQMELVSYDNNRIPLFETDFLKLKKESLPKPQGNQKAIKLSVSLATSSYASVLIREMTKRDLIDDEDNKSSE